MKIQRTESLIHYYPLATEDDRNDYHCIPDSQWERFAESAKSAMMMAGGFGQYGRQHYLKMYSELRAFGNHPFRANMAFVYLVGSLDASASVGPWARLLTTQMSELVEINVFRCVCSDDQAGKKQDIIMEFVNQLGYSYLCGGMTNYSGEGYSALQLIAPITEFVSFITGCKLNFFEITGDWEKIIEKWYRTGEPEEVLF